MVYVPEAEAWLVTRYEDIAQVGRNPETRWSPGAPRMRSPTWAYGCR